MEQNEIDYLKDLQSFITKAYEKRRESTVILNEQDIMTPDRLNFCLGTFTEINDTLLFDYRQEMERYNLLKTEFDHWKDEKFLIARSILRKDIAKSQTLSQREIDAQAYHDNKQEWDRYEQKLFFIEAKCTLYKGLRENWTSHSFMLKEIAENMKSEMHNLNADRIVSKSSNKVIEPIRMRQLKQD